MTTSQSKWQYHSTLAKILWPWPSTWPENPANRHFQPQNSQQNTRWATPISNPPKYTSSTHKMAQPLSFCYTRKSQHFTVFGSTTEHFTRTPFKSCEEWSRSSKDNTRIRIPAKLSNLCRARCKTAKASASYQLGFSGKEHRLLRIVVEKSIGWQWVGR